MLILSDLVNAHLTQPGLCTDALVTPSNHILKIPTKKFYNIQEDEERYRQQIHLFSLHENIFRFVQNIIKDQNVALA